MNTLNLRVAGVTFDGRQEIIGRLSGDEICQFRPEPENPYDANAIAIYVATPDGSEHVGYVPKDLAAQIAPFLDGESLIGNVSEITGGFVKFDGSIASYGLRVVVVLPNAPSDDDMPF